jgi:SNARE protein
LYRLIRDFEREARTDGIPYADLASRKKILVQELNNYISMKKERSRDLDAKKELVGSSISSNVLPKTINGMYNHACGSFWMR